MFRGLQKTSLVDYPNKLSTVVFTYGCNFRCPYCHNGHLVSNKLENLKDLEESYILDLIDQRKSKNIIDAVVISGGEPTLWGDRMIEFARKIKEKGVLVKIDTNGTNPGVLSKLITLGLVDYIAMDIKAPMAKYEALVGAQINIDDIKESIRLLKESNIHYEFRTTVCKELLTKSDVVQIIKELSPFKKLYLQNFHDGDYILGGKGRFSPVDFLDFFKKWSSIEIR